MAIHRPAAAFLDIIERKQNNLHISRITTVISDVFYTSNLFPGVRFGRRNLEDAVCQLLNEGALGVLLLSSGTHSESGLVTLMDRS
uniref:Uncharacterized protein n=1 Tax=Parascaris equorum TaxID=6256 RepID=A0A914RW05_PAREQ